MNLCEQMHAFKRKLVIRALKGNRWNQCHAADELGIHRNTIKRAITELGIQLPSNVDQRNAKRVNAQNRAMKPRESGDVCSAPVSG